MPWYEFECEKCGMVIEDLYPIDKCPNKVVCTQCNAIANKIISFQGGFKTDHPSWINDHLRSVLQKDGEKPIETRKEHDEYLKKNNYIQRY